MLVTNPSGVGGRPERIQREFASNGVSIEHLIGLEHGFLGLEEEFSQTPVTMDSTFGRPLYHIYKVSETELKGLVNDVDVILFDVQDVGMRCYTYLSVLKRLMDASSGTKIKFVLLDHVHQAMHLPAMGPRIKPNYKNFAGEFPGLFITGMTLGEAAQFYNGEYLKNRVDLQVILVKNYKRSNRQTYEGTGLIWNTPSPNLPFVETARNYLSLVLLEGVNVSVGRGTQAPFVYFGSPWMVEPNFLLDRLDSLSSSKYYYSTVFFKPTFGPHKGKVCFGLRLNLLTLDHNPIELAYNLIFQMKEQYPKDFKWNKAKENYWIDLLWGSDTFRLSIEKGLSFEEFALSYEKEEKEERGKIAPYLLY